MALVLLRSLLLLMVVHLDGVGRHVLGALTGFLVVFLNQVHAVLVLGDALLQHVKCTRDDVKLRDNFFEGKGQFLSTACNAACLLDHSSTHPDFSGFSLE